MAREIVSATGGKEFPPTVYLDNTGDFVKGRVVANRLLPKDKFGHIKPVTTLELLDLKGVTKRRPAKGEKAIEVDVLEGSRVDIIGSGTELMSKLPQLQAGDVVTITNGGTKDTGKGNPLKLFKVEVE